MADERAWRERCETCVRASLRGCEWVTDCTQRTFSESTNVPAYDATKNRLWRFGSIAILSRCAAD